MRRDDDRLADAQADLHDLALDDGQFFVGQFDAEIAARDHDRVGFGDDFTEIFDRLLVLDFGDDERPVLPAFDDGFQLLNVLGLAHERERDVIDTGLQTDFNIPQVLGRERGQADFDTRQIDVTAAAKCAFGEDLAFDFIALLGQDLHLKRAVVEQNDVTDVDVFDEILVVHIHRVLLFAPLPAHGQGESLARLQIERHL